LVVQFAIQSRMSFSSAVTVLWAERRIFLSVSSANQRSTRLSQDEPVGVKCCGALEVSDSYDFRD